MPWGPRARPSDGSGQAGRQLRREESGGRDGQDSSQRAAGGRGQRDVATLGGVRPGGFGVTPCSGQTPGTGWKLRRHPREAQPKSAPKGKRAHGLGIHGRHRASPITGARGLTGQTDQDWLMQGRRPPVQARWSRLPVLSPSSYGPRH